MIHQSEFQQNRLCVIDTFAWNPANIQSGDETKSSRADDRETCLQIAWMDRREYTTPLSFIWEWVYWVEKGGRHLHLKY